MSRIEDLIAEHCPNGVKFRVLGDVGEFVRGNGLQKSDLIDTGVPAIHYGEVHTHYGTWAVETKSFIYLELARKLRKANPGDLVIATTSEDDESVGKAVAWLGDEDAVVSGDAYIFRHVLDPKFVAYFFQSSQFLLQKRRLITGTKVRRISGRSLERIRIPVPPLEIQHEIVRILDRFTELEAELEFEIESRTAQHAAYRSRLLRSKAAGTSQRSAVRRVALGSISRQYIEPVRVEPETLYKNLGVKWYGEGVFSRDPKIGKTIKASTLYKVKPGQFIYNRMFVTEGSFGLVTEDLADGVVSKEFPVFDLDLEQVVPEWLLLKFQDPFTVDTVAAEARGGTKSRRRWKEEQFEGFEVDLPSLAVQLDMVSTLSAFLTLRNLVGEELRARHTQYEYYRDKLLTFEELAA